MILFITLITLLMSILITISIFSYKKKKLTFKQAKFLRLGSFVSACLVGILAPIFFGCPSIMISIFFIATFLFGIGILESIMHFQSKPTIFLKDFLR